MQRCPLVPTAENNTPRNAKSRSALSLTIAALLPPSSRIVLAKRDAATCPTARPIAVLPVAETSAMRGSATNVAPISHAPMTTCESPSGASSKSLSTLSSKACVANAVSGVFSDGFQITLLPHTSASAAFHAQTATGKLNALMISTGPSGCHCSIIR